MAAHARNFCVDVAGPRASKDPQIYEDVKEIIQGVLRLTCVNATPGKKLSAFTDEQYAAHLPFQAEMEGQ